MVVIRATMDFIKDRFQEKENLRYDVEAEIEPIADFFQDPQIIAEWEKEEEIFDEPVPRIPEE